MNPYSLKSFWKSIGRAVALFSVRERIIFILLIITFFGSILVFTQQVSLRQTHTEALRGGTLREGVLGTPRFINPLLATTGSELDLTTLIYSGLVRKIDEGVYVEDLAESYEISDDGKTYTFHLRDNLTFHDGAPLDANDVVFTIEAIQDPELKSHLGVSWKGVEVTALDSSTVEFQLSQAFAGFLDNATVGILPEHIWDELDPSTFVLNVRNARPIGSGPYRVSKIKTRKDGSPREYRLRSFKNFALGKPYIRRIFLSFFEKEEHLIAALRKHNIHSVHSISPEDIRRERINTHRAPLSRVFGIFFNTNRQNQSNSPLTDLATIMDQALNREVLIENVFDGLGTPITSGLPPQLNSEAPITHTPEEAYKTAEKLGWIYNETAATLVSPKDTNTIIPTLSLATGDADHLIETAEQIREQLATFGIPVELTIYDSKELSDNILPKRDFDALLFGQSIQHDTALYAFWHSSQRNHPGLNITQYVNSTTDKLLESARTEDNPTIRATKYQQLAEALAEDHPAVFLYTPDFVYNTTKRLHPQLPNVMSQPHNRFNLIHEWYVRSRPVWNTSH